VKRAIWWIRRDLRLSDNPTLQTALEHAEQVLPVFILDPRLLNSAYVGEKRLAFLFDGLRSLDRDLKSRGSRLFIRRGDPVKVLHGMCEEFEVGKIFAEQDYSPYARQRDHAVADALPLELIHGLTIQHPSAVRKRDGDPYRVYSPYRSTWKAFPLPQIGAQMAAPERLDAPEDPQPQEIPPEPTQPANAPFPAGEAEARRRLNRFIEVPTAPIFDYLRGRDRLGRRGTSQLSPYLRFGMLSAQRAAVAAVRAQRNAPDDRAKEGAATWLDELIWRDFYVSILHHFPKVRSESFRHNLRAIRWSNEKRDFEAWKRGETGYPVVDAGMRQLQQIGWMHNRARMIVASFLVKDLLIDWRWGERWFMQHLLDGDPASNNGGWQWSAGTGTDAAPYFRVFNPTLQGEKFDPDGAYIRRWTPELQDVPDRFIHEPWKMPEDLQRAVGCVIGRDYPAPIIDHAWARERALDAYRRSRQAYEGNASPNGGES
jgi:deoxyribodipyrimidine photo-lyase